MKKTIYQKIHSETVRKIKQGLLKCGDNLPSTRNLAKAYQCHRLTVMKAFQDLIAEGWIETSERRRYRISAKIPISFSEFASKNSLSFEVAAQKLARKARKQPEIDLERIRHRIEFWGGQPDLRLFPRDEFRRILSQSLKRAKPDQLSYGLSLGLESCRKEVSEYLRKSRNLVDKEFMMTNGSQEALLLIAQTFTRPGDKVAVEKKGYPPAWRLFESLGLQLIPIEVDAEGLNTQDLADKMKSHQVKMIYVTPLHQYPTTVTLSPRRRQQLLRLAEKKMIPILEDDYDHEFHYTGPPPSPLSSESSLGIYICSFSKVLFPGARLGVIGCHQSLLPKISSQKFMISRQTDSLSQLGLGAWIREGGFERHVRRMCRIYEGRFHFMQDRLKELSFNSRVEWQEPTGGMSLWVDFKKDTSTIADQALKKGVFFQHESSMDYFRKVGNHLRIGFAGVNEKEITEGLQILGQLLRSG